MSLEDFEILKKIGNGSFGKVFLAKHKPLNILVSIKQLDKKTVVQLKKQDAVMREKAILKKLQDVPFIVELLWTFMDDSSLYFVFDHCKYGNLSNLIDQQGILSDALSRFYAAEIVLALKYMHERRIMH